MESKVAWQSKTAWIAVLSAVAAFFPPVQVWISEHPDTYAQALSVVFLVLRFVSKDKVVIK